jgi:LysM repeat protein
MKVHTVRRGETLGGIARKYATSPERLMRINGLRKPVIFPGQTLLLSGNVSRSSKAAKSRAENAKRDGSRSAKKAATTTSSKSKSSASAKPGSEKRSGADSKVGARTKSNSANNSARAE